MRVSTSPVFYFGILLAVAITGLLVAPYVIDWNSYRADLEAYGRKLTGRPVTIEGRISATLFPTPTLTAERVSIANPQGLQSEDFAHADRVKVRMTLAGLAQGTLAVDSIDVEGPVINVERLATGEGNWAFQPSADLVRSDLLSRVKLDRISLSDGTINIYDRRRGETVTLDDFNASLSSPSVRGPWRMRSTAVFNDRLLDIGVTTAAWREGEPFRLGVRVAHADNSGLVYSFDGGLNNGLAEGDIRVEPAATGSGKSDAEGAVQPLRLTAKVKAGFDRVQLDKVELTHVGSQEGGTLASGTAELNLGSRLSAKIVLNSATLDLDALSGAKAKTLLREGGGLALANSMVKLLPKDTSIAGEMTATALMTEGETLDNVTLAFEADANAIRVKRFQAGLPGQSDALFNGVFFPDERGGEISGALAVGTADLRTLGFWASPEAKAVLEPYWTGSRGRFKMQTDVSVTPERFRLSKAQFELDGQLGSADLSITSAGRGAVDLRVDGGALDLDSYAPSGIPALPAGAGLGSLVQKALPHVDAPDMRLSLSAKSVRLNGTDSDLVSLDLQSGASGLDLRKLEIGSVGGANVSVSGLVLDGGKGADGSINLVVKADDPRGLLRLAGIVRGEEDPAWALDLGPTDVSGNFSVKPSAGGPDYSFDVVGTAGTVRLKGEGTVSARTDVSASLTVATPDSGRLLALFGRTALQPDNQPGLLKLDVAGTPANGYFADAQLSAYGAQAAYKGSVDPLAPGLGLDGHASLRSTDAGGLAAASGMPLQALPQGLLTADSPLTFAEGRWVLGAIDGRLGTAPFRGQASLDPGLALDAHIEVGDVDLTDVLAAGFLGWSGAGPDLQSGFAATAPFGVTGQLWLKPRLLTISNNFAATGAEIGFESVPGRMSLSVAGKDAQGRDAQINIDATGTDSLRSLKGRVLLPVDLAKQLALVNGSPVAEGEGSIDVSVSGSGRTPAGALAGLTGSGSYDIDGMTLTGLSPDAFTAALAQAKDSAGITAAFDALRSGKGLVIGRVKGTITITNGEVALLPFGARTPDADVTVKTIAELATGEMDTDIALSLKARDGLPGMSVSYAGPPSALVRSEDNNELATKLGVTLMTEGIDQLEKLQQEQKRLAEEEEKQRIEDEARLQAYYAQRDELLLRKREVKVHAEMQAAEAERLRIQIEAERAANAEISKSELKQRMREIRVYKRMARLSEAAPKPQAVDRSAAEARNPPPVIPKVIGPVVIDAPDGAPVVISPPPGASPTQ